MGWLFPSSESLSSKAPTKNIVFRLRESRSLPPCFLLKLGVKFVATCQLLSEVFLSGWKKVRLNFTCQSYFKTFPLLWYVCGRTSRLDLDLLYNYPNRCRCIIKVALFPDTFSKTVISYLKTALTSWNVATI